MTRAGVLVAIVIFTLVAFAGEKPAADPSPPVPQKNQKKKKPDPNEKMLEHTMEVFDLLSKNQMDCDKAVRSAIGYVQKHKKELLELRRQAEKLKTSLCPKSRKKYNHKMAHKARKMGKKYEPMMYKLFDRCPKHVDKLYSQALQYLGSKCQAQ